PRALAAAETSLDAVTLAAAPNPKAFDEREREFQSRLLAHVASTFSDRRRYDDALTLLGAARQLHVNDVLIEDIIFANVRAGRFDAARDEIDRYPGGAAADPRLYLIRAFSHESLGDNKAALADYKAGFAAGVRDDDYASQYVKLMLDQKLDSDAVAF